MVPANAYGVVTSWEDIGIYIDQIPEQCRPAGGKGEPYEVSGLELPDRAVLMGE